MMKKMAMITIMVFFLLGASVVSVAASETGKADAQHPPVHVESFVHVEALQADELPSDMSALVEDVLSGMNLPQGAVNLENIQLDHINWQELNLLPGQQQESAPANEGSEDQDKQQESQPSEDYAAPGQEQDEQPAPSSSAELTQDEQQMVNLVNQARQEQGLQPLEVDTELVKVARVKAQDMIDNQYFSHHSPTYGSPFEMLDSFGVQYRTAGENLAGNHSVQAAHQGLMNSDGHRANILGGQYSNVGIGVIDGGPYGKMFVQLFTG